jgi:hypothetical protein
MQIKTKNILFGSSIIINIIVISILFIANNKILDKDYLLHQEVSNRLKAESNLDDAKRNFKSQTDNLNTKINSLEYEKKLIRNYKKNPNSNQYNKKNQKENYVNLDDYLFKEKKKQKISIRKSNYTSGHRIGAICRDGTRSYATGRGACSWHGGVDHWLYSK